MGKQLLAIIAVTIALLSFSCDGSLSFEIDGLWFKSDDNNGVRVDQYLLVGHDGTFNWVFYVDKQYSAEKSFSGVMTVDEESYTVVFEPAAVGDAAAEPIIKNFVMKNETMTLFLLEQMDGTVVGDRFMRVQSEEKLASVLQDAGV